MKIKFFARLVLVLLVGFTAFKLYNYGYYKFFADYKANYVGSFFYRTHKVPQVFNSKENYIEYPILLNNRKIGVGDINGDGLDDLVIAPTLFSAEPLLPIEVWMNLGEGQFENTSEKVFQGLVPTTGSANNIFVRDFTGDTLTDIFIIDQGLEGASDGFRGGRNLFLVQQKDGTFKNSSDKLPDNENAFNHPSSVADLNGDGFLDLVLTRLGGERFEKSGTMILENDKMGGFVNRSYLLPDKIRWRAPKEIKLNQTVQFSGSNGIGDLDGDGVLEIVTASYGTPNLNTEKRDVCVFQKYKSLSNTSNSYIEKSCMDMPIEISKIPYNQMSPAEKFGAGAAGVYIIDLNGDGQNDILVQWETANRSFVTVYINKGNFSFVDETKGFFKSYETSIANGIGGYYAVTNFEFSKVDGAESPMIFSHRGAVSIKELNSGLSPMLLPQKNGGYRPAQLRLKSGWYVDQYGEDLFARKSENFLIVPMHLKNKSTFDLLLVMSRGFASSREVREEDIVFKGIFASPSYSK